MKKELVSTHTITKEDYMYTCEGCTHSSDSELSTASCAICGIEVCNKCGVELDLLDFIEEEHECKGDN